MNIGEIVREIVIEPIEPVDTPAEPREPARPESEPERRPVAP
jgi:hypothetical protein